MTEMQQLETVPALFNYNSSIFLYSWNSTDECYKIYHFNKQNLHSSWLQGIKI